MQPQPAWLKKHNHQQQTNSLTKMWDFNLWLERLSLELQVKWNLNVNRLYATTAKPAQGPRSCPWCWIEVALFVFNSDLWLHAIFHFYKMVATTTFFLSGILKELTSVAIIFLHWSTYKAHRIIMRTVSSGENLRLLGAVSIAENVFFAGSIAALLAAGGATSSPAHRSITKTDNHQSTLTPADNLELPIKLMRAIKREAKVPVETPQQPQETNPSKPLHQKCTFSKLLCTLLAAKSESKTLAQPLALMWRMMKSFRTLPSILFRTSTSPRVIWCI